MFAARFRRNSLIYILVLLMFIMPPLMLYQTTETYAIAITLTTTMLFLGGLALSAIGGYVAYQNKDVIASGTQELENQIEDLWESQKVVGKFAYENIDMASKYFYHKLANGSADTELESKLDSSQISAIEADISAIESNGDLEKAILEKYELKKIQALAINNYINAPYEKELEQGTFKDGYTTVDGTYHYKVMDESENYKKLETINSLNTAVNTSIKTKHDLYINGIQAHHDIYQYFTVKGRYFKLHWNIYKDTRDMATEGNEWNNSYQFISMDLKELSDPVTGTYKNKEYKSFTRGDRNNQIHGYQNNVIEYMRNSLSIDMSYLQNMTVEEFANTMLNYGQTGVRVYQPTYQGTLEIPNVGLDDVQSVCSDDVVALAGALNNNLSDKDTYPVDLNYDGESVTVGDVTVNGDGTVGDGAGTGTGTGTGDLTVPQDVTLNFEPLMKFGSIFTTKFPFCIPWDIKRSIEALIVPPEAPKWTITFDANYFVGGGEIVLDFAQFEELAKVVRWGVFIIFCMGLMIKTRDIIKG